MTALPAASGTLYTLGLGPGDPELLTLKAARILRGAPVFAHFAKRGRDGHARTIAAPHPLTDLEVEFIESDIDAALEQARRLVADASQPLALPGHG